MERLFAHYREIHLIGLSGTEGAAMTSLLARHKVKGVIAHDFCDKKDFKGSFEHFHQSLDKNERQKLFKKISQSLNEIHFKDTYLEGISQADLILAPQAWYKYECNKPLFEMQKKSVPFKTMTQLYLELNPGSTIGITGSNGKTTVSRMIEELLRGTCLGCEGLVEQVKSQKKKGKLSGVYLVGNDRLSSQILEKVEDLSKNSALVMEISNRQLKFTLGKTPDVAVITNINPNHLDEHDSFREYLKIKQRIIGENTKFIVLNYDNPETRQIGEKNKKRAIFFSLKKPLKKGIYLQGNDIFYGQDRLCSLKNFPLPGTHNKENALAAVGALLALSKLKNVFFDYHNLSLILASLKAIPKRLEFISEIAKVRLYNDLSATTPTATLQAIRSFIQPITVIMGGDHKCVDYDDLVKEIVKRKVKVILLPGSVRERVQKSEFADIGLKEGLSVFLSELFFECEDLTTALILAKKITAKGGVILVSPGGEKFISRFVKGDIAMPAKKSIFSAKIDFSSRNIWRYGTLLNPNFVLDKKYEMAIDKEWTPLQKGSKVGLFFKREDLSVLGSHKSRSLAYQVSVAKKQAVSSLALSTTGNAGICAAAYCQKAQLKLFVFVSERISKAKLAEMKKYEPILISSKQASAMLEEFLQTSDAHDLRPSRDDLAIKGMKSLGFELFEQMPDIDQKTAIFIFGSSGATVLGLYEAFNDLLKMREIKSLPQLHVAQTGGISAVARHFDPQYAEIAQDAAKKILEAKSVERRSETVIKAVSATNGWGWYICENFFNETSQKLAKDAISTSEEGGMAYAAYLRAFQERKNFDRAVVVLTGKEWGNNKCFRQDVKINHAV